MSGPGTGPPTWTSSSQPHGLAADHLPDFVDGLVAGAIDDDAQGALLFMLQHEHDRPREVGIAQMRRGDEELAGERFHGLNDERHEDTKTKRHVGTIESFIASFELRHLLLAVHRSLA